MKQSIKRKTSKFMMFVMLLCSLSFDTYIDLFNSHEHGEVSAYAAEAAVTCTKCGGDGKVACPNTGSTARSNYRYAEHDLTKSSVLYHWWGCWPCGELTATTKHI